MLLRAVPTLELAILIGAAPGDDGVKFTASALQKGAHAEMRTDVESTMSTSIWKSTASADLRADLCEDTTTFTLVITIDVTASEDGAASEARIRVDRANESVKCGGLGERHDMPGAGASWNAKRRSGEWKFEGEAGELPDERLARILNDSLSSCVGKPSLATLLDGKTLKTGEKITVEGDAAKKAFTCLGSTTTIQSLELVLESTSREGEVPVAVFAMKAKGSGTRAPGRAPGLAPDLSLSLEGEITVCANSLFVLRGNLHGPITMSEKTGEDKGLGTVFGSGRMTWTRTAAFR